MLKVLAIAFSVMLIIIGVPYACLTVAVDNHGRNQFPEFEMVTAGEAVVAIGDALSDSRADALTVQGVIDTLAARYLKEESPFIFQRDGTPLVFNPDVEAWRSDTAAGVLGLMCITQKTYPHPKHVMPVHFGMDGNLQMIRLEPSALPQWWDKGASASSE